MIKRNPVFTEVENTYLFAKIARIQSEYQLANPHQRIFSLTIGDTSLPITESVVQAFVKKAQALGTNQGYQGYSCDQGDLALRNQIITQHYQGLFSSDEVFISDGAKSDLARLFTLFPQDVAIGLFDPSYPAYNDACLLSGRSNLRKLVCLEENGYLPVENQWENLDVVILCHPNNPLGIAYTREQLQTIIRYCTTNKILLIFDVAYQGFIKDSRIPRSIYEIEGSQSCSIEIGSFSKVAGFTGIRLGWSLVPKELKYTCGSSILPDVKRLLSTVFNGVSHITTAGGFQVLTDEGIAETRKLVNIYMKQAQLLKKFFVDRGFSVSGGENCPFLWIKKSGYSSNDLFNSFLERWQIIGVPGDGFGEQGADALRLSAFIAPQLFEELRDKLKS